MCACLFLIVITAVNFNRMRNKKESNRAPEPTSSSGAAHL
jgi:hypothetical protein